MKYEKMFQQKYDDIIQDLKTAISKAIKYSDEKDLKAIERKLVLAYIINNGSNNKSEEKYKLIKVEEITNALKLINYTNTEYLQSAFGIVCNESDIGLYVDKKNEEPKLLNPNRMPAIAGYLKNNLDFIGVDKDQGKSLFYLKDDAVRSFKTWIEKNPENPVLDENNKDLKKVLLKILDNKM